MTYTPLSEAIADHFNQPIRLLASDFDGTLTKSGKITPQLLQGLADLANAGLPVLIVTGRSAGWVSAVANYLPVMGAIAENGGVFISHQEADPPLILTPIPELKQHRLNLSQTFAQLQAEFPQLQPATDNPFRFTDWTFDIQGLTLDNLQKINQLCLEKGWGFTYSSIQCHIKPATQDKATGLLQLLSTQFPDYSSAQVLTVGDSPNDESLFNPEYFPNSVGVANLLEYREILTHAPAYVTQGKEVDGFCELVKVLLQNK
jgi:hydroxymethylpyrimidine pyrophosphatase-like HAD family hydrolase